MPLSNLPLIASLRFYSRLPLPSADCAARPFDAAQAGTVPLAGAIIGLVSALVLGGTQRLFPVTIAAVLALAALVAVTGALHEDGLADCADAQGATTPARKLEIMRDSRIGSFGAIALALSLFMRAGAIDAIAVTSTGLAMAVLVAAAALSRTAGLLPAYLLPPARTDGAGAALGRPLLQPFLMAGAGACALTLLPMLAGAGLGRCVVAIVAALAASLGVGALAKRQIGGFTGDVLGAAQQLAEIAAYLVFAAS